MYNYKRWMIGLDNTAMDKVLVSYVAFLSTIIAPVKMYFIHVNKDLDVSEKIRQAFPELQEPKDEIIEAEMKKLVVQNFPDHINFDIEYEARQGNPVKEILEWSHIKNIDLLLVGRKSTLSGSGILAQKLARKVACSILFVPEQAKHKINGILVSTDFSNNSRLALEKTVKLAKKYNDTTVYTYHSYQLPTGYYYTGKSADEFAQIMLSHANEYYDDFIKDIDFGDIDILPIFELDKDNTPAKLINQMAHTKNVDLIVIGARGHTSLTSFLLGSITEQLILHDHNIPLLVVKEKDKVLNFLELIKTI